ncbi:glycosyl hydrolase family 28 protein [Acutalibacter muris]|jgi:hypothetical protein|uniref:glycosyl hydrolase family 28 protein n=1 Tax=Acutalibacter muris TaxID=1796620 RepID=UPI0026F3A8D1|nr:glycosyl hydrolase family 28 protein [Acutalibacter muris]
MTELPLGDGIHDDAPAIQALLDSGLSTVRLPAPEKCYTIYSALHIHSNTSLILDGFTTIRLADGANAHMLVADDPHSENISVSGGIWDFNNLGQAPNPMRIPPEDGNYEAVTHFIFYFENVKNLYLGGLTIKDPTIFASTFDHVEQFTVQDITFDFNFGNPNATNMDGIHLNGGCRFGRITNLKGACYDDMVALNADEGRGGPIEDIQIDGLFCEGCHSAVRLLSRGWPVRRVHISNVYGTFFQYCVGVTRYSDDGREGVFDQLHLSDIYASKAPRLPVHGKEGGYVYALIWIEGGLAIDNLQIDHMHRREAVTSIPTLSILPGASIRVLGMEHISQENATGEPVPLILNQGNIDTLYLRDVQTGGDRLLINKGRTGRIISDVPAE